MWCFVLYSEDDRKLWWYLPFSCKIALEILLLPRATSLNTCFFEPAFITFKSIQSTLLGKLLQYVPGIVLGTRNPAMYQMLLPPTLRKPGRHFYTHGLPNNLCVTLPSDPLSTFLNPLSPQRLTSMGTMMVNCCIHLDWPIVYSNASLDIAVKILLLITFFIL